MSEVNRQVVLVARPTGIPQTMHFELREAPVPTPADDQVLVRNRFLSVDPAMRGWVSAAANYSEPVPIDGVMRSIALGEVVATNSSAYSIGDLVCGLFGWQEYAAINAGDVWFKHDTDQAPPSASLGILGLNGITAYFGLLEAGCPQEGETVVVSTAAGAVGSAVGQIARIKGCRTVGITSSAEKQAACRDTFGFDAALSYRSGDLDKALAEACPDGVDVYFDNTGGQISDTVYRHLAVGARCVVCGTAATASWDPWPQGARAERHFLVNRASMQGILVFDWVDRFHEARTALAQWLAEGKLAYREEFMEGLEAAPGAIAHLYASNNQGKLIIRL